MTHGLHLNLQSKRKLTLLTADGLDGGHVSGVSSTSVITHARVSHFFKLNTKTEKHLKNIDSNYLNFINHDKNVELSNSLYIFHQNVRGLRSKSEELIHSLDTDNINPHILCFSEHHTEERELLHLTLHGHILGSSFCRKKLCARACVCVYVCVFLLAKT
jgi:hypothetical protein